MTSPEPAHRPHLVDQSAGLTASEIWDEQARAHSTRRDLAEMHRQVEEMRGRAQDAYLAECQRLIERTQAGDAVAASQWPHPAPPGAVPDPVRPEPVPAVAPPGIRWPEDEAAQPGQDDERDVSGTLRARAAALFKAMPTAPRSLVKDVLGCNEYQAKKLHGAKDEILREVTR